MILVLFLVPGFFLVEVERLHKRQQHFSNGSENIFFNDSNIAHITLLLKCLKMNFKIMAESHFSLRKIINWMVCAIFLLFAFVQLNDPDPYVWVAIYGLIAIFFAVSNFRHIPKIVIQVLIIGLVLFSLYHVGYFYDWLLSSDKSELFGDMIYVKPYVEGTREFMGLVIALLALIYLLKRSNYKGG